MSRDLREDYLGNLPPEVKPKNPVTNEDLSKIYGEGENQEPTNTGEIQVIKSTYKDIIKVSIEGKTYNLVADSFVRKMEEHVKVLYAKVIKLEREKVESDRKINNLNSTLKQTTAIAKQVDGKLNRGRSSE